MSSHWIAFGHYDYSTLLMLGDVRCEIGKAWEMGMLGACPLSDLKCPSLHSHVLYKHRDV